MPFRHRLVPSCLGWLSLQLWSWAFHRPDPPPGSAGCFPRSMLSCSGSAALPPGAGFFSPFQVIDLILTVTAAVAWTVPSSSKPRFTGAGLSFSSC